jgi:hypothetical protein
VRAHSERHQTAHAVNFLTISDNGEQQEYAGSGSRYVAQHRRARRRWQLSGRQVSADRCCVLVWSGSKVTKWQVAVDSGGESQNKYKYKYVYILQVTLKVDKTI